MHTGSLQSKKEVQELLKGQLRETLASWVFSKSLKSVIYHWQANDANENKLRTVVGSQHGWSSLDYGQGWTLNFESTRHLGEWPSKCTRPDQFSLAQKFTPLAPLLKPLRLSNHFSHLLFLPLITGSFRGFFLPFSLRLLWRLLKYISTFFFILYAISFRENTQRSESWESTENNSLATSSSTMADRGLFSI